MATLSRMLKSSDGTDIYADASGNPKNPSIVFVHGLAMAGGCFDPLFANQRLLDRFYLVRYDLRGHGRSGGPESPTSHTSLLHAHDVAAVVREFGLKKPLFVGWSIGACVIADICANLDPLPISGAIALGGFGVFHFGVVTAALKPTCEKYRPGLVSTTDPTLGLKARLGFVESLFRDSESIPFAVKSAWLGYTAFALPEQLELARFREQDLSKLSRMRKDELRLLILCGDEDKMIDGVAAAKELKSGKVFGDVEIEVKIIEGGSHSLFVDNVEETVDVLFAFAQSIKVPIPSTNGNSQTVSQGSFP